MIAPRGITARSTCGVCDHFNATVLSMMYSWKGCKKPKGVSGVGRKGRIIPERWIESDEQEYMLVDALMRSCRSRMTELLPPKTELVSGYSRVIQRNVTNGSASRNNHPRGPSMPMPQWVRYTCMVNALISTNRFGSRSSSQRITG